MGCGQSNEDSEQKQRNQSAENESTGAGGEKQQKEDAKSETSKPATKKSDGVPRDSNASPQNTSLSPQNGSMNQSGALGSSSSFASAPGVTMPTHTITDSTGHKVTSCIGSRNKLETVTRWLDSVVRHRDALPEGKWRNPQDEAGREKQLPAATSSQHSGATPSERSGYIPSPSPGHGQPSTASASQLSLQVPGSTSAAPMNESTLSNQPFYPQTPQNAEMLSPIPGVGAAGSSPKFEKLSNSQQSPAQSPAPAPVAGEGGTGAEEKKAEEANGNSPQAPNETSKTNPPPTPREEEKKITVEAAA